MTAADRTESKPGAVPGRTTITARALQRYAVGLAKDTAGVTQRDVDLTLTDDNGGLRVSVTVPVTLPEGKPTTLLGSSEQLRHGLTEGMRELTGRTVVAVDVRYSGVRRSMEKRVR